MSLVIGGLSIRLCLNNPTLLEKPMTTAIELHHLSGHHLRQSRIS